MFRRPSLLKRPVRVIPFDPTTTAWINAVVSAGGAVSGTQEGFVDTLVKALKADGSFGLLSRLWLHANHDGDSKQATIDLINAGSPITVHGSPTLTVGQGYTGDGSTTWLDTGFQSDSNFTQNSACLGSYVRTSRASSAINVSIGNFDGATIGSLIDPLASGSGTQVELNGQLFHYVSASNAQGLWTLTRTTSSALSLYLNGSSTPLGTVSADASSAPVAFNFSILAANSAGTVQNFSSDQIAISFIGGGLTGAQIASLSADLNAYMTSLGTNVY